MVAKRGKPVWYERSDFRACFDAKAERHSHKPDAYYSRLVRITRGKRLSMFERVARSGFETWGAEAPEG